MKQKGSERHRKTNARVISPLQIGKGRIFYFALVSQTVIQPSFSMSLLKKKQLKTWMQNRETHAIQNWETPYHGMDIVMRLSFFEGIVIYTYNHIDLYIYIYIICKNYIILYIYIYIRKNIYNIRYNIYIINNKKNINLNIYIYYIYIYILYIILQGTVWAAKLPRI